MPVSPLPLKFQSNATQGLNKPAAVRDNIGLSRPVARGDHSVANRETVGLKTTDWMNIAGLGLDKKHSATTRSLAFAGRWSDFWAVRTARLKQVAQQRELAFLNDSLQPILQSLNATNMKTTGSERTPSSPPTFEWTSSSTQRGHIAMDLPYIVDGDTEIHGILKTASGKTYKAYLSHTRRMDVKAVCLQDSSADGVLDNKKEKLWVYWRVGFIPDDNRMYLYNKPCRVMYTSPTGKFADFIFNPDDKNYKATREQPAIRVAVEIGNAIRAAVAKSRNARFFDCPEETPLH